jgi:hypothetical protein
MRCSVEKGANGKIWTAKSRAPAIILKFRDRTIIQRVKPKVYILLQALL